jgi:hypothetical protein
MWIKDRKRKRFRTGSEFSSDHIERRGVSHVSTLVQRDDMAGNASHFRDTFAVIGVRRKGWSLVTKVALGS